MCGHRGLGSVPEGRHTAPQSLMALTHCCVSEVLFPFFFFFSSKELHVSFCAADVGFGDPPFLWSLPCQNSLLLASGVY